MEKTELEALLKLAEAGDAEALAKIYQYDAGDGNHSCYGHCSVDLVEDGIHSCFDAADLVCRSCRKISSNRIGYTI